MGEGLPSRLHLEEESGVGDLWSLGKRNQELLRLPEKLTWFDLLIGAVSSGWVEIISIEATPRSINGSTGFHP